MDNTIFIQNMISPYRNRFFNVLSSEMKDFSVYYMGVTEFDRNWDVSKLERNYSNWVDKSGHEFKIGGYRGHLNPRLVWKLLRNKEAKNIIMAVSWQDPNIMAIAFAKKLHLINKRLFFWAEANYTAEWAKKYDYKIKWWFKRAVFNSIDGALIIPGKMSEITFEKWGIKAGKFIYLPNTIDDSNLKYIPGVRNSSALPIFLMPIRIIEKVKGGLNFFTSIGDENIRKAKFIIAGDGDDKELYAQFIRDNHYEDNIILEGFCDSSKMMDLYNKVNALVLPSFSDPSPLSLVEACLFHLPILCSKHCGNHFEAVEEGVNGYTYSPLKPEEIKQAFERFLKRRNDWAAMGEVSASIYEEKFETQKVIQRFVQQYSKEKRNE